MDPRKRILTRDTHSAAMNASRFVRPMARAFARPTMVRPSINMARPAFAATQAKQEKPMQMVRMRLESVEGERERGRASANPRTRRS